MSAILAPFKKIYDLIDGFVLIMLTAIGIALIAPEIEGVKVTVMVQLDPAASVEGAKGQVLVWL